ncbi:hypothetical protein [Brevundimonas sp.]|uniref:hypothetical protein n=1 Tax=Brevundimonas sp. TaxID=1871086 RepID=UPI003564C611
MKFQKALHPFNTAKKAAKELAFWNVEHDRGAFETPPKRRVVRRHPGSPSTNP